MSADCGRRLRLLIVGGERLFEAGSAGLGGQLAGSLGLEGHSGFLQACHLWRSHGPRLILFSRLSFGNLWTGKNDR